MVRIFIPNILTIFCYRETRAPATDVVCVIKHGVVGWNTALTHVLETDVATVPTNRDTSAAIGTCAIAKVGIATTLIEGGAN